MKAFRIAFGALVIGSLGLGCTSSLRAAPETVTPLRTGTTSVSQPESTTEGPVCDVICEGAKVTNVTTGGAAIADAESFTIKETQNANAVLSTMHDDFVACYKSRLRVSPTARGTLQLDVLIGSDGKVRKVDTTGGETLGAARECIVQRVQGGAFEPPHGGGTLRVQVPLTLRLDDADSST